MLSKQKNYLLFIFVFTAQQFLVESSVAMKRLYEDLFTDYNKLILPVGNNRTKVTVTLGLKLGQILDLNLKQQILSTNVWVEQTWHDYKLTWNPEQFDNIDMIHVPAENIWIPDIVLFNNADGNYELTLVAKARVYANGTVVWRPPTMFRSTCEIDVEYFPFDIQTCYLRFGSWTYAGDEVELRHVANKTKANIGIDLSQFYKNVEWDIIDVPAYYNEVYYECCNEPFPDITFKIVIRRKMLFYLVNLILPVALMTFMTVSVFYLPSDSNEKVTLSISILTSLIVFFLLMLEIIPASSLAVPLFGKYLLFTLVLVSLSACVSVYVLNIHHRSPSVHQMSPRLRRIFLHTLPRLLHFNQPDPRERSSLNRFRKKKVAQQLMNASVAGGAKVYDVTQPVAASINLIETLHKSYAINPNDDKLNGTEDNDDEGRYFRRYVDDYIERLKKTKCCESSVKHGELRKSNSGFCLHSSSSANDKTFHRTRYDAHSCFEGATCSGGRNNRSDWPSDNSNSVCNALTDKLGQQGGQMFCSNCHHRQASGNQSGSCRCAIDTALNRLNDDTLDLTFDCDDQVNEQQQQIIMSELGLPTPPPPPRQIVHLTNQSADVSSVVQHSRSINSISRLSNRSKAINSSLSDETGSSDDHELVDKLISSIQALNNASDELDTTATNSNDEYPLKTEPSLIRPSSMTGTSQRICGGESGIYMPIRIQQSLGQVPLGQVGDSQNSASCNCWQNHMNHSNSLSSDQNNHHSNQSVSGLNNRNIPNESQHSTRSNDLFRQKPSELLLSLRLPYDQMPPHVRAAIRSILFIADTIKNEDDENSAIEDWESMSMVVDRLSLWLFLLLCTFGSIIILALAPSLYDQRASIDDELRTEIPTSNCSFLNSASS